MKFRTEANGQEPRAWSSMLCCLASLSSTKTTTGRVTLKIQVTSNEIEYKAIDPLLEICSCGVPDVVFTTVSGETFMFLGKHYWQIYRNSSNGFIWASS